jgi:hypothetical protein
MSAGKGDKPRPVNKKIFDQNFDLMKSQEQKQKNEKYFSVLNKKGKTTYVYKN